MIKKQLLFATANPHKLIELRKAVGDWYEIAGLKDLDIHEDIPETGITLEENAKLKAEYLYDLLTLPCLAEDTGLEVFSLGGAPGVHSARYSGIDKDPEANNTKLLHALQNRADRSAQFRTVIALVDGSNTHLFEGICMGKIALEPRGTSGFGYDPIFVPDGFDRTFAEMSLEEKSQISHRAKALQKLVKYLQNQSVQTPSS